MKARPWLRKLFIALAAPFALLALLEVVFAMAGVEVPRFEGLGNRNCYWLPWQQAGQPAGYDRQFRRKYKEFPEHLPLFVRDKPKNGWRVFVLGESTVEGFPFEAGCFTDWLRLRATAMLPDRAVEVVNAGNAGWDSPEIRCLLQECLQHEPDVVIWAVAQNEYTPHNILNLRYEVQHPVLHTLRSAAVQLRTTEVLGHLVPALHRKREDVFDDLQSAELPCFGPELPLLKERFRENTAGAVADAHAAGVPILLCTMPRNVREFPPNYSFFSEETRRDPQRRALWDQAYLAGLKARDTGDTATALEFFAQARDIDAVPAKLHYAMAQTLEAQGRGEAARTAYMQALEQDGGPNRAHAWEEEVIRSVAAATGVPLVDFEALFDARGKLGLTGYELLTDNVHPNLEGHEVMASAIIDVLEHDLHVPFDRSLDVERVQGREQLGITTHAKHMARKAECLNLTRLALQAGVVLDSWKRAHDKCVSTLAEDSNDWEIVGALGCLEAIAGRQARARTLLEQAIANNPYVKTEYVVYAKLEPHYQRAFAAAGMDMSAVEASLLPQQKMQVENRLFRARTR